MPHKFNVLTQNIHTLRLSVGGHTHGQTDRRTENIYSIFRDKLLLLGEHVQVKMNEIAKNMIPNANSAKKNPNA